MEQSRTQLRKTVMGLSDSQRLDLLELDADKTDAIISSTQKWMQRGAIAVGTAALSFIGQAILLLRGGK